LCVNGLGGFFIMATSRRKKISKKVTKKKVAVVDQSQFAAEGRLVYAFLQESNKLLKEAAKLIAETNTIIQRGYVDEINLKTGKAHIAKDPDVVVNKFLPEKSKIPKPVIEETVSVGAPQQLDLFGDPPQSVKMASLDFAPPNGETVVTKEEISQALKKVLAVHNIGKVTELLSAVNAKKVSEVDSNLYPKLLGDCQKALEASVAVSPV